MANTITYKNTCTASGFPDTTFFSYTSNTTRCEINSITASRSGSNLTINVSIDVVLGSGTELGTGSRRNRILYLYSGCSLSSNAQTLTKGTLRGTSSQLKSDSTRWTGGKTYSYTRSFTINVGTGSGTLSGCALLIGPDTDWDRIPSTASALFNGLRSSSLNSNASAARPRAIVFDVKYDATWTNCTGPTKVSAPSYAKKDSTITVSWSGAKAGTNNAINKYWLYANGVSQGDTTATSKTYKIPGTGTYKFTVVADGVYNDATGSGSASTIGYTDVSGPTSVYGSNGNYVGSGKTFTLYWSGAKAGTNNSISYYTVTKSPSTTGTNVGNVSSKSYTGPTAGNTDSYTVKAIGVRNSSSFGNTSATIYGVGITASSISAPTSTNTTFVNSITLNWNIPTIDSAKKDELSLRYVLHYRKKEGINSWTSWTAIAYNLTSNSYTWSPELDVINYGESVQFKVDCYVYYSNTQLYGPASSSESQTFLRGTLPNHAESAKLTIVQPINKFDGANIVKTDITYSYAKNEWTTTDGQKNDFKVSDGMTITITLGEKQENYRRGASGSLQYLSGSEWINAWTKEIIDGGTNNGIIDIEDGKVTFTHDVPIPPSVQVRIIMRSFHIINGTNVYSPDNDIYITGLSSAQEASFNPELTILPSTNQIIQLNYNDSIVSHTDFNFSNIQVIGANETASVGTSATDFQNVGFKLQVQNNNGTFQDIATDTDDWKDENGKVDKTTNIFYPSFSETYNQTLSMNFTKEKWFPSYIRNQVKFFNQQATLVYRLIPYNKYGTQGTASSTFSVTVDFRVIPEMIESPEAIITNMPAIHNINNIPVRTFWNGITTDTSTKSYLLFEFYPAYDANNKYRSDGTTQRYYNKKLLTTETDGCTYKLIRYKFLGNNNWQKKSDIILPNTTDGIANNLNYGYIATTEQSDGNSIIKYQGYYQFNLDNNNEDEIIYCAIVPTAPNTKTIENINSGTKTLIHDFGFSSLAYGQYYIARVAQPQVSINSIERVEPEQSNADSTQVNINYDILDAGFSQQLNGSSVSNFYDEIFYNTLNNFDSYYQREGGIESSISYESIPQSDTNKIYTTPEDTDLKNREGYNYTFYSKITYPVYTIFNGTNAYSIEYHLLSKTLTSITDTFYLVPSFGTLSFRRNKIGINNSTLLDKDGSLTIYPKYRVDNNNWHNELDTAGTNSATTVDYFPHIVEIASNDYSRMPNYNGENFVYPENRETSTTTPEGAYIGFFTGADEENVEWQGSIGFEGDGKLYGITGLKGQRKKHQIAFFDEIPDPDLTPYLKIDGTRAMTANIQYNMFNLTTIPVEIYQGSTDTGVSVRMGATDALIVHAGESGNLLKEELLQSTLLEDVNIIADNTINFYAGANSGIETKKGFFVSVNGNAVPFADQAYNLGNTDNNWLNLYVHNIRDLYDIYCYDRLKICTGGTSEGIYISNEGTIHPTSEGVRGHVGTVNWYFESMHADNYIFNNAIYLRYANNSAQLAAIEQFNYVSGAGTGIRFGGNQSTAITAGEGALGVMTDSSFNAGEYVTLAADSTLYFVVNCNTYTNKKNCYMNSSAFAPSVNNSFNLGTSSQNWTGIYGTTIYTDKIEFANNDNITYNDTSNLFSFVADGSVNSSFLQFGQLSVKPAKASSGFGVWYLSGTNDVCVIPLTDLMHQTNGKGNIGTGSYKWDYVQANHVTGTSDLSIKQNMIQFDEVYAYNSIKDIPIYSYKMIDRDNTYYIGTTTQEMPVEMVHLFDGGAGSEYLPNSSIWFLYGAFKEAQRKIEESEEKIALLEEQIKNLTLS